MSGPPACFLSAMPDRGKSPDFQDAVETRFAVAVFATCIPMQDPGELFNDMALQYPQAFAWVDDAQWSGFLEMNASTSIFKKLAAVLNWGFYSGSDWKVYFHDIPLAAICDNWVFEQVSLSDLNVTVCEFDSSDYGSGKAQFKIPASTFVQRCDARNAAEAVADRAAVFRASRTGSQQQPSWPQQRRNDRAEQRDEVSAAGESGQQRSHRCRLRRAAADAGL
jgi:hypothetical protein